MICPVSQPGREARDTSFDQPDPGAGRRVGAVLLSNQAPRTLVPCDTTLVRHCYSSKPLCLCGSNRGFQVESTRWGQESCRPALATAGAACRAGVRNCRWRRERLNSWLTGQSKALTPWRKSPCASGALPHMAIGVNHEAPLVSCAEAPRAAVAIEQLCHPLPFSVGEDGVYARGSALTSWTICMGRFGSCRGFATSRPRASTAPKATNALGDGRPRCLRGG
jgi:hypothetical protein